MSEQDPLTLSSSVLALIDAERRRPDEPNDRAERVFERFATSVALGGSGATTHGPENDAVTRIASALTKKTAALVLFGAFVLGGGAGAALHARFAAMKEAPSLPAIPPPMTATPDAGLGEPEPVANAGRGDATVITDAGALIRPPAPRTADTLEDRDVDLSRERAMIDRARMASARHDLAGALGALEEHARLFPSGRLAEEREALAVGVLADLGHLVEARARSARFKKRYPTSVFLPAVDAALERARNDSAP